jgi:DNA-binding transcriptional ArsR family regulator
MNGPQAAAYPPVRIVSGPVFEVIAELSAYTSGPARPSLESGKAWIREARSLAGPELIERVERWAFSLYGELASFAVDAGPPYSVAGLVAHMRRQDPDVVYRRLLGAESVESRSMVSDGAFERAISGDAAARTELRSALAPDPAAKKGLDQLFATPPAKVQAHVTAIVEDWAARVSPAFADVALDLVARDIEPKQGLLQVTAAKDALRVFTRGVDIDPQGWAEEIVVVPTVALRPFMAPVESGSRLIILCSVADETLDADPAAPPRRLVQASAALADELRLRILRELSGGEYTAKQIASRLGVDGPTLHPHLGVLRAAGLVSIRAIGVHSWRYSLRTDGIAAAAAALNGYLRQPGA